MNPRGIAAFAVAAFLLAAPLAVPAEEETQGFAFTIVSRSLDAPGPAEPFTRLGQSGTPIEVRLMGRDLVALLLIVPFETVSGLLTINLQSQVWHRNPGGSLSYHSAIKTIAVPFGGIITFHPLGVDPRGVAPVSVDIRVDRR